MRSVYLGPLSINPNRLLAGTTLVTAIALGGTACGTPEKPAGIEATTLPAPTANATESTPATSPSPTPHAEDYSYLPHEPLPTSKSPDTATPSSEGGSSVDKGMDGNTKYCTSARKDVAPTRGNDGKHVLLTAHGECAMGPDKTVVRGYKQPNDNSAPTVTVPNGEVITVECIKMGEEIKTMADQYTRPGSTRQTSSNVWLRGSADVAGGKTAYFAYAELGFPELASGGLRVTMCASK